MERQNIHTTIHLIITKVSQQSMKLNWANAKANSIPVNFTTNTKSNGVSY